MKKIKRIIAALLGLCVVAGGTALTACSGGDDGVSTDDVQEIIKDEETWDKAFEDIEWINLSCLVSYEHDYDDDRTEKVESYAKLTETAMHCKIGNAAEYYSAKNNDGTYTTYRKYSHEENFVLLNDKSDSYYQDIKLQLVLQVSYANYFELFNFEKDTNSFVCNDEIEVTVKLVAPGGIIEEGTMVCTNNVIKALNGKIIYIKSNYSAKDNPDAAKNASFEYYDIGSTTVTIPQEVIDNAVPEA